jgi:hypothetical protein
MKALSVRQPFADLIVSGLKPIENRTWRTSHRGLLYIHAGTQKHSMRHAEIEYRFGVRLAKNHRAYGAIIGHVELVDIVEESSSRWFDGPYGWVFVNPARIEPIPYLGMQGLFSINLGSVPVDQ